MDTYTVERFLLFFGEVSSFSEVSIAKEYPNHIYLKLITKKGIQKKKKKISKMKQIAHKSH